MSDLSDGLRMYQIFRHPDDYPDHFVVRGFTINRGIILADAAVHLCDTLEQARDALPDGIVVRLPREDDDLPSIVESWV